MRILSLITFLTLMLSACQSDAPSKSIQQANSERSGAAPTVNELPVLPVTMISWVDQLRVRALPTLDSRVIVELVEGDTLFYMNQQTVRTTKLRLRDKNFNRPWIKVQTPTGLEGWVYEGGVVEAN